MALTLTSHTYFSIFLHNHTKRAKMNRMYTQTIETITDEDNDSGNPLSESDPRLSDPFLYIPEIRSHNRPKSISAHSEPEVPYETVNAFCLAIANKR